MTTNANARNETLLPRDVLAQNRALGTWCASRSRLRPSDTSTIGLCASMRGVFTGSGSGTRFARFTRGEERECGAVKPFPGRTTLNVSFVSIISIISNNMLYSKHRILTRLGDL